MTFSGFTNEDFDVFSIEGLENRMDALINRVRPKLDHLGRLFAPELGAMTGNEMFYHTAKHARRTKNPPNDTWVAFSSSNRGYKMLPHFQIGLWETHIFAVFAVIYEAPSKPAIGKALESNLTQITAGLPGHFVISGDHTKPDATPLKDMNSSDLAKLFKRLQTVKKAELVCGLHIPREKATLMSGEELIHSIHNAFAILVPLYKLS
ncbi:MAG TPA: DUF1054 domain-containing protein [Bacillaceae bacterium]